MLKDRSLLIPDRLGPILRQIKTAVQKNKSDFTDKFVSANQNSIIEYEVTKTFPDTKGMLKNEAKLKGVHFFKTQ